MDIGDKIRKVRELKGLKQEYVANQLGMSVTAYENIESDDSSLTFDRLEQIAAVLEVPVPDILNIPEQLNIQTITTAHQVGFGHTYNDNRVMRHDEIEAFKNSITHLEKEIEYLRQQNTQLLNLIAERK
jgi:transcriptional regulator with XRE-family HTH domain